MTECFVVTRGWGSVNALTYAEVVDMKVFVVLFSMLFLASCGGSGGGEPVEEGFCVEVIAGESITTPTVNGQCVDSNQSAVNPTVEPDSTEVSSAPAPAPVPVTLTPTPSPVPVRGECVDTAPINDGFGWDGVGSCSTPIAVVEQPQPEPEPEPEPQPEPTPPNPEPAYIVKSTFQRITAYVLSFSFDQFNTLQVNALFKNSSSAITDAQCRLALISGVTEVGFTYISVSHLLSGDSVPDASRFLTNGLNRDSFDAVRLSGCFNSISTPRLQAAPEPEFDYIVKTGFEGIHVYVKDFSYDQFGSFQVNGVFKNTTGNTTDAQCRLALISGLFEVTTTFISIDDLNPGETAPDSSRFLVDGLSEDSFDRARLSDCFSS